MNKEDSHRPGALVLGATLAATAAAGDHGRP